MGRLTNTLLEKFGNPNATAKYKTQLSQLEDDLTRRIKEIEELKDENHNAVLQNELYEGLLSFLKGSDGRFSRKILCLGCDSFIHVYRIWKSKLVPAHDCKGWAPTLENINSTMNKEVLVPISDSVKDAEKEMKTAQKFAKDREDAVRQRIQSMYINEKVDSAMGIEK